MAGPITASRHALPGYGSGPSGRQCCGGSGTVTLFLMSFQRGAPVWMHKTSISVRAAYAPSTSPRIESDEISRNGSTRGLHHWLVRDQGVVSLHSKLIRQAAGWPLANKPKQVFEHL
jgi:hypothetical protein